jgi:O-antigen ligase
MRLTGRSRKQTDVDIKDYYALNVGAMWRGLKQESWAFWWLCIYFFFEYVRPQNIYTVIDILPWTQLSLLATLVTVRSDRTVVWVRSPANAPIILFYLLVLLSSLFAFRPSVSWSTIDIAVNWIVAYFLIITIVNSERRFFIFLLLFLLVNFKMSLFGFRTFVMRGFSFARWGVSGSPGWFQNGGDFALQMDIFTPLAIVFVYTLRQYWGRMKRLLLYLLPLSALVTIVASSSRGGQLGLAGAAAWYLLKSRIGLKAIIWIIIAGWLLYQVAPPEMLEKFEVSGEDRTSQARLAFWGFGREVIKDFPVLGVGYDNWLDYCWFVKPGGFEVYTPGFEPFVHCLDPHNTYIEAAAEIGIPGFLLYVFMILLVFVINARTRVNAKKTGNNFILYTAHALDGGLVGYLISSTFLTVLFYPMFWFQLAFAVALHEVARRQAGIPVREAVIPEVPGESQRGGLPYRRK